MATGSGLDQWRASLAARPPRRAGRGLAWPWEREGGEGRASVCLCEGREGQNPAEEGVRMKNPNCG